MYQNATFQYLSNFSTQRLVLHFFIFLFSLSIWGAGNSYGQLLPAERQYQWELAGFKISPPSFAITKNILDFGGDNTGASETNTALQNAISVLHGNSGVIYFPPGEYLFSNPISLPDSIILRGSSREETTLRFDFGGVNPTDQISVSGAKTDTLSKLIKSSVRGMDYVVVDSSHLFSTHDYIDVFQTDSAYVRSEWAWNSSGQICKVKNISGDTLFLDSKLRRHFFLKDSSRVVKVHLKSFVGIECLKIINHTQTIDQTSIIHFKYTSHCWVSGIESDSCHFAHVAIAKSTNTVVKNSYFHRAFSYGGGGEGYGISLEYTSGECLILNNIFSTLRHALLLQSGANGNVIGYNYVLDPKFPGDVVLHGNYPYANLFEGNTIPTIVIDNSHYINGPHNFFYRNRATLFGISMNTVLPSDSQTFAANEITNPTYGLLSILGNGQITEWNNKNNAMTGTPPSGYLKPSYYFTSRPDFFYPTDSWPPIGYPTAFNTTQIPAEKNYSSGLYAYCGSIVTTTQKANSNPSFKLYPNPTTGELFLYPLSSTVTSIKLYNSQGKFLQEYSNPQSSILMENLPAGVYLFCVEFQKDCEWHKIVKVE